MTPERLAEIRARLEAATPGPWGVNLSPHARSVAQIGRHWIDATTRDLAPNADDATFIANAPTDIAALLAEVERLQAELERSDAPRRQAPTIPTVSKRSGQ